MTNILFSSHRSKFKADAYLDSMVTWWVKEPTAEFYAALYGCYGATFYQKVIPEEVVIARRFKAWRVSIHQPPPQAISHIFRNARRGSGYHVNGLHIAVDLPPTPDLPMHILQKGRRVHKGYHVHVTPNVFYSRFQEAKKVRIPI